MMSMTGYGLTEEVIEGVGQVTCEIKTLNSRYQDIIFCLPDYLNKFEKEIKELLSDKIHRGKLKITLNIEAEKSESLGLEGTKEYIEYLKAVCKHGGISEEIRISDILLREELFVKYLKNGAIGTKDKLYKEKLKPQIKTTLQQVLHERKREGEQTKHNLLKICKSIEELVINLSGLLAEGEEASKERFKGLVNQTLKEFESGILDEQRLHMELALLITKLDLNEEVERLSYHVEEFKRLLLKENSIIGKRLEFMCQEMQRETNTLCAKTSYIKISKLGIEIKTLIEGLKEQLRNIE